MRWLVAAVVAGCSAAPAIGPEPAFDAGQDASPATGGNAQGGAPAGGAAGSGGSGGLPGAGGAAVSVTAKCETVVGQTVWAVASFPGKSADDLLRVTAYIAPQPTDSPPAGLDRRMFGALWVGAGKVGAVCGYSGAVSAPELTFVLPP